MLPRDDSDSRFNLHSAYGDIKIEPYLTPPRILLRRKDWTNSKKWLFFLAQSIYPQRLPMSFYMHNGCSYRTFSNEVKELLSHKWFSSEVKNGVVCYGLSTKAKEAIDIRAAEPGKKTGIITKLLFYNKLTISDRIYLIRFLDRLIHNDDIIRVVGWKGLIKEWGISKNTLSHLIKRINKLGPVKIFNKNGFRITKLDLARIINTINVPKWFKDRFRMGSKSLQEGIAGQNHRVLQDRTIGIAGQNPGEVNPGGSKSLGQGIPAVASQSETAEASLQEKVQKVLTGEMQVPDSLEKVTFKGIGERINPLYIKKCLIQNGFNPKDADRFILDKSCIEDSPIIKPITWNLFYKQLIKSESFSWLKKISPYKFLSSNDKDGYDRYLMFIRGAYREYV